MSENVFENGPLFWLQRRLGLIKAGDRCIRRRILLAVIIGWVPLAILSALRQWSAGDGSFAYFARDAGVHVRFLVAFPLLIAAESWCLPRLSRILSHFLHSGVVAEEDKEKLSAELTETARLWGSAWFEIVMAAVAYACALALGFSFPVSELSRWQVYPGRSGLLYTLAGQWHFLVSLPLLILFLLGWLWRQLMWGKLLRSISMLKLRLIAAHPDRAGGLGFLGVALQGYWPLSFAFSSIVAGRLANELQSGSTLYGSRYFIACVSILVLMLFLIPFITFVPALRQLRERGHFEYGVLGITMGRQFEDRWMYECLATESMLAKPDFSATTDLYSIVNSTYQIKLFPIDRRFIYELIIATLLPFVPLMLAAVPLSVVLERITKLVL